MEDKWWAQKTEESFWVADPENIMWYWKEHLALKTLHNFWSGDGLTLMELMERKPETAGKNFSVVVLNDEILDEIVQLLGQEQGMAPLNKMEIFPAVEQMAHSAVSRKQIHQNIKP